MTKTEWLNNLEQVLSVEIPKNDVNNNISFYKNYIETESHEKNEEDVLDGLGDPRLIAHTIIDTYKMKDAPYESNHGFMNEEEKVYSDSQEMESENSYGYHIKAFKWYHKFGFLVLGVGLITTIIFIGSIVFRLLFTFGFPILLIWLIIRFFRQRG